MLMPIDLPPGLYRNGTDFQSINRWRDANLVRWHEGALRPVGGWSEWGDGVATGIVRGAHAWTSNNGTPYLGVGAADSLEVFTSSDAVGDITPAGLASGNVDTTGVVGGSGGYGTGVYGAGTYGALTFAGTGLEATVWSLDNWGENLVACNPTDGNIYEWAPPTVAAASVVSNAPTDCLGITVTEERILMAFGASGNPRKIAWSDQEDNTVWTAAATNQAGDIELQSTGQIMQGVKTRGQVLILTSTDAHTATYVGPNDVYRFERASDACGTISRAAGVYVDSGVYWMGTQSFYRFSGQVQQVPCEVSDYVFSDINRSQAAKIWACSNTEWSEIWWFYPSGASNEIDRYVAHNHVEGTWITGDLERTAGVAIGTFPRMLWLDTTGQAYIQERGYLYDGAEPFAETGPIIIGNGTNTYSVLQLYPDEQTEGEVTATFKTRFYPNGPEYTYGPYVMNAPTSVRFSGRQVRMRCTGAVNDDWRVGVPRLDIRKDGLR